MAEKGEKQDIKISYADLLTPTQQSLLNRFIGGMSQGAGGIVFGQPYPGAKAGTAAYRTFTMPDISVGKSVEGGSKSGSGDGGGKGGGGGGGGGSDGGGGGGGGTGPVTSPSPEDTSLMANSQASPMTNILNANVSPLAAMKQFLYGGNSMTGISPQSTTSQATSALPRILTTPYFRPYQMGLGGQAGAMKLR